VGFVYRYRYLPRACLPAPPGVFKPPIVQYSTFRRARASFQIFSDAHSHSRTPSSYRYVSEKYRVTNARQGPDCLTAGQGIVGHN